MKYNVGDHVRIKNLDWYNENKDNYGAIYAGSGFCFWKNMARHCGEIMKITTVKVDPEDSNKGYYFMENSEEKWTDGMIEGLVEEETVINNWTGLKVELELSKSVIGVSNVESLHGERFMSGFVKAIIPPEGYIFKDEKGNEILTSKIILEKKKKEYPKTYDECAEIIAELTGSDCNPKGCMGYMSVQLTALQKLLICRDAYWKIAGDELGLGEPWKPDWNDVDHKFIIQNFKNEVGRWSVVATNSILAFPTAEMRDAFYDNFYPDIEICKELL